ncbi:MAG: toll/interleukin-1 receptor domain-containing protein [Ktedonobacteraceae bacterium]|nr:toll/interleukin-1 receptor domain-containing protein [Ktedonobacteraceae bacterium]
MPKTPEPVTLFLSYAHEDEELLNRLVVHLSGLKRQGVIKTWYDRQIFAGKEWAKVLDTRLEQASVILLLVSPDFLASDYCYEIEVKRALERHDAKEAIVMPIVLRPCDWSHTPLARLQVLPQDGRPITKWENRDTA